MTIVIPYQTDIHRGIELLYALRSIDKYLTGYEDIYLIGDKPKWVKNVKHLPCSDIRGRKEYSIAQKILTACKCEEVSEDFIMWHDDHYLLEPLYADNILYWQDGPLAETLKKAGGGYSRAIANTIETGCELNFDVHTPIIFNKQRFIEKVIKQDWQTTKEFCIKSLYCKGFEGEYMKDLKINLPSYSGKVRSKINGRQFFSTGPLALHEEMMEVFNELYPERSKFEL